MLLLIAVGHSQEPLPMTKKSLEMEIEEIKKRIAEEENLWAEEKSEASKAEDRRKARLDEFRVEKQKLIQTVGSLEEEIQKAVSKIETHKNQKIALERNFDVLSQSILSETKFFAEAIQTTIPYQKDKRIENIKMIERDLFQDKVSAEEGFSRLFAAYAKELTLASDAEMYSGEVEAEGGNKIAVKFIRVGKQVMAYSSPTGSHLGILRPKSPEEWVWVTHNDLDFDSRKAIRDAIAIAEGKAPPGFAELPFWLADFANDYAQIEAATEPSKAQEPAKEQ
jgi:hypothetical protein